MGLLIQVVVTGISVGAIYGLFSICITALYRLTGVIHLALGELAGAGFFATVWILYGRDPAAGGATKLPFLVGATGGIVVAGAFGYLVYRGVVRPFVQRGFSLGWIGGLVAAAIALHGIVALLFTRASYVLPYPVGLERYGNSGVISLGGGASVQVRAFVVLGVATILVAALTWFLDRSRFGRGLRAMSQDTIAAALCGVPANRIRVIAFTGAAVVVTAAALVSLPGAPVSIDTTTLLGLKGLVAAVAAGFGSPRRVLAFALGLGVLETSIANVSLGSMSLGPSYQDVLPIAAVLLVMALRRERTVLQEVR